MRKFKGRPYLFYGFLSGGIAFFAAYLLKAYADTSIALSGLIAINIAAFLCMGLDKSFARAQSMRIPEAVLYVLALLGGSMGIIAGIYIFKHKTRKAAFQFVLLIVVAIQIAVVRFLGFETR